MARDTPVDILIEQLTLYFFYAHSEARVTRETERQRDSAGTWIQKQQQRFKQKKTLHSRDLPQQLGRGKKQQQLQDPPEVMGSATGFRCVDVAAMKLTECCGTGQIQTCGS